jgi:hypothetical protein
MHLLTSNFAVEVSSLFLRQTSLSINPFGSTNNTLPITIKKAPYPTMSTGLKFFMILTV